MRCVKRQLGCKPALAEAKVRGEKTRSAETIFWAGVWTLIVGLGIVMLFLFRVLPARRKRDLVDHLSRYLEGFENPEAWGWQITTIHVASRDGYLWDWTREKWSNVEDTFHKSGYLLFRVGYRHREGRIPDDFSLFLHGPFTESYLVKKERNRGGGYEVRLTTHGRNVWDGDPIAYDGTSEKLQVLIVGLVPLVMGWCVYHHVLALLVLEIRKFVEDTKKDFPDQRAVNLRRLAEKWADRVGIPDWVLCRLETEANAKVGIE